MIRILVSPGGLAAVLHQALWKMRAAFFSPGRRHIPFGTRLVNWRGQETRSRLDRYVEIANWPPGVGIQPARVMWRTIVPSRWNS